MKPEPTLPPRAIPTKRRRLAYEKTPGPLPFTSRDVVYETPTPQPLSIKRDVDDDDYNVSDSDLRVEPDVLDYGAMNVGALASPYVSPICMNLRNAVSIQCMVSEEKVTCS